MDFAYAVHTDVGNCCVAARINGEITPLRTRLKSGDRVEIITAPAAKPIKPVVVETPVPRSRLKRILDFFKLRR